MVKNATNGGVANPELFGQLSCVHSRSKDLFNLSFIKLRVWATVVRSGVLDIN